MSHPTSVRNGYQGQWRGIDGGGCCLQRLLEAPRGAPTCVPSTQQWFALAYGSSKGERGHRVVLTVIMENTDTCTARTEFSDNRGGLNQRGKFPLAAHSCIDCIVLVDELHQNVCVRHT